MEAEEPALGDAASSNGSWGACPAKRSRERLLGDPQALREHLRDRIGARYLLEDGFDQVPARALELLLDSPAAVEDCERAALRALAGSDPLNARVGDAPPSAAVVHALGALVDHYRHAQLERVDDLAGRYGECPRLRAARRRLNSGELFAVSHAEELERQGRG